MKSKVQDKELRVPIWELALKGLKIKKPEKFVINKSTGQIEAEERKTT